MNRVISFIDNNKTVLQLDDTEPLWVDFSRIIERRGRVVKQQGLVRACKPKPGLHIIDATAGWGRDAAILASFGASVIMLERHPTIGALLENGLERLREAGDVLDLSLVINDARSYLKALLPEQYPDVIYMDPMHPVRQKSALVKKDMQILQHLIGPDEDASELLSIARERVLQRVVLKWPKNQKPLLPVDYSIVGKTVRFDVYLSFHRTAEGDS